MIVKHIDKCNLSLRENALFANQHLSYQL